jgi:hypothetical protein
VSNSSRGVGFSEFGWAPLIRALSELVGEQRVAAAWREPLGAQAAGATGTRRCKVCFNLTPFCTCSGRT